MANGQTNIFKIWFCQLPDPRLYLILQMYSTGIIEMLGKKQETESKSLLLESIPMKRDIN